MQILHSKAACVMLSGKEGEMRTEYMKEFLELADAMNYSAAAKKLFISQPALSRHIKAMEKELGFRLVETSSHGIEFTQPGKSAVKTFRRILREYDSFLSRNAYFSSQVTGKLSIGILYYLLDDWFACYLDFFRKKYPYVRLSCFTNYQPQTLKEDLLRGRIQLGSYFSYKGRLPDGMKFQKLGTTHMVAMMREDHPMARKNAVTVEELSDIILVRLGNDDFSEELTQEMLQELHVTFRRTTETDNIEMVPFAIRSTGGIHITGESCRRQQAPSIVYKPIIGKDTIYDVGLASMVEDNLLVTLFMEEAKQYFTEE